MKMIAVLFDFDGVLLDSLGLHLAGWKHAAQEVCQRELSEQDIRSLAGMSTREIGRHLAQTLDHHNPEQFIESKIHYVRTQRAPLFSGAKEAIDIAQTQAQACGIVSNAPRNFIEYHLQAYGIENLPVFGIEDHPKPKPDPSAYARAAARLNIHLRDYQKVLVLEDSRHGLIAGLKAHMHAVGICSHLSAADFENVGAKASFASALEAVQHYFS